MKKYASLFAAVFLLGACHNRIDFGPNEGVSYRDAQNQPMGPSDPSDWAQDGQWNSKEVALFRKDLSSVNVNAGQTPYVSGISFFPNPVQSTAGSLTFLPTSADGRLHTVFVDRKYNVITRADQAVPTGGRYGVTMQFSLPTDKFKNKEIYRLYYVFYAPDGTLRSKGHGDVKIAR
ncbi:hypothetical protein KLP40_02100 [Hymenobacter sp. NST-14]|uniref:hypothetical protein n=1 Tax=Hymenobacter piscis TaxID=2839984 RepID=UPI001C016E9A|nr:hypothetical protein [Hymenobacter piscis]MBT9391943.1 hypothetical protein [Hymenobacter piscis]